MSTDKENKPVVTISDEHAQAWVNAHIAVARMNRAIQLAEIALQKAEDFDKRIMEAKP